MRAFHDQRMEFIVRFEDDTTTVVHGAYVYEQEGPLTTFFDNCNGGGRLASAWTVRVGSFRTSRILEVRRLEAEAVAPAIVPKRGVVLVGEVGLVDHNVPALVTVAAEIREHVVDFDLVIRADRLGQVRGTAAFHAVDLFGDRHQYVSGRRAANIGNRSSQSRRIEIEIRDQHTRLGAWRLYEHATGTGR